MMHTVLVCRQQLVPLPPVVPVSSPAVAAACADLLVDPVVNKCGHDFCKLCMEQVFSRAHRNRHDPLCPVCRTALAHRGRRDELSEY